MKKISRLVAIIIEFVFIAITSHAQEAIYPSNKLSPEKNLPVAVKYRSEYVNIGSDTIHYFEKGEGEAFLFLHGIPTSSYLWRNVIDQMPSDKRSIAIDFLGYGKSSMPSNDDFSFLRQVEMLEGFLDSLEIQKVNLVVNDIGSMFGLYFAMKNESRINSIVLVEAVILPAKEWYENLPWIQRKMFATVQKSDESKQKWMVEKDIILNRSMKMLIKRNMSKEEMEHYTNPFDDKKRRKVMTEGTGPSSFTNKGVSQRPDDEMALQNWYTEKLKHTEIPILLLYAYPGWLINEYTVNYARENFKNYTDAYIGKGKHFVQEDQPTRIAQEINVWFDSIVSPQSVSFYNLNRMEHVSSSHRKIHTEIVIDQPIDKVWQVMTDFKRVPEWSTYFQGIEGDFIDGNSIVVFYNSKGSSRKAKAYKKKDILVDTRNHTFGWANQRVAPGLRDNHQFKLVPLSDNKTKLIHTDEVKGLIVVLMGKRLSNLFYEFHTTYNEDLKRECEKIGTKN